ncbi:hypothetical protein SNOG_06673 [Parastagonospora nodorum SN15]|uniref:Uncharacterized protein n=1 Tax=Phaeosphaeria nodorum (strain SN15 / ATCC MYA-4574 / FGSC 10173) TaxID=321614 RepID=Q0UNJ1_PHANO|nr:hypothetical protein SNOG_06673 [Parastagonospora nodorum SN15]EAT86504.1 hypothetical protein SNOG_06673 [Parastagonospora nodorum SN15]
MPTAGDFPLLFVALERITPRTESPSLTASLSRLSCSIIVNCDIRQEFQGRNCSTEKALFHEPNAKTSPGGSLNDETPVWFLPRRLLDERAEKPVEELLPYLKTAPDQYSDTNGTGGADQGPNRHFRRLVVPELAARGDRSILFPGHIHSAFTPFTAELQALWRVSWMLGLRDLPPKEEMEFEAATFNAWTRKRYLEQCRKHSYFIYDYIPIWGSTHSAQATFSKNGLSGINQATIALF